MKFYANIFTNEEGSADAFEGASGAHFQAASDPFDVGNRVLSVSTVKSEEPLASVINMHSLGDFGGCASFGMRYCFEPISELSMPKIFSFEIRNGDGESIFSLNFDAIEYSGGDSSKIAIKLPDGKIIDGAILNAGRWYTISAKLFTSGAEPRLKIAVWDGAEMIAYNDVEVGVANAEMRSGATHHFAEGLTSVQYFDDIFFSLSDERYSFAPCERVPEGVKIYDFENGIPSSREFNVEMLLGTAEGRVLLDGATWTSVLQSDYFKESRNLWEILLVLSGSGRYVSGGEEFDFREGSIFVSTPGTSRNIVSHGGYKILSVTGIFDKLSFVKGVWALSDNVYGEGRKIAELILYNRFGRESYAESLCTAYIEFLMLSYKRPEKSTTAGIHRIIERIERDFSQSDLSIGELLEESGYTRDYIRSEFISVTKMTPKKYLNNIRMKNAKQMIEMHGDTMSLSDIADACGIIDQSVFSRIFKKHFGISPTAYKDSIAEKKS